MIASDYLIRYAQAEAARAQTEQAHTDPEQIIDLSQMFEHQRERILEAYRHLTAEQRQNVIAELAELSRFDPDTVAGESHVTEEMDIRNSREYPY